MIDRNMGKIQIMQKKIATFFEEKIPTIVSSYY